MRATANVTSKLIQKAMEIVAANAEQIKMNSDESKKINDNIQKISIQMKSIFSYNANRDEELEKVMQTTFVDALLSENLLVYDSMVRNIYTVDGTVLTEFDGVFIVENGSEPTGPCVVHLLETKQVMDMRKYNNFLTRIENVERDILRDLRRGTTGSDGAPFDEAYVKMVKYLNRYLLTETGRHFSVKGVVCSPSISADVLKRIKKGDDIKIASFVTLDHDQFKYHSI